MVYASICRAYCSCRLGLVTSNFHHKLGKCTLKWGATLTCRQPTRSITEKPIKPLKSFQGSRQKINKEIRNRKQENLKECVGRPAHRKHWACERSSVCADNLCYYPLHSCNIRCDISLLAIICFFSLSGSSFLS